MIKPLALVLSLLATSCYASDLSDQYWKDWLETKKKQPTVQIVTYVYGLSKRGSRSAEAAAWFLCTGGKYGFSKRKATPEEKEMIYDSLRNVSYTLSKSPPEKVSQFKCVLYSKLDISSSFSPSLILYNLLSILEGGIRKIKESPTIPVSSDKTFEEVWEQYDPFLDNDILSLPVEEESQKEDRTLLHSLEDLDTPPQKNDNFNPSKCNLF